jgi:hypothetical protein
MTLIEWLRNLGILRHGKVSSYQFVAERAFTSFRFAN